MPTPGATTHGRERARSDARDAAVAAGTALSAGPAPGTFVARTGRCARAAAAAHARRPRRGSPTGCTWRARRASARPICCWRPARPPKRPAAAPPTCRWSPRPGACAMRWRHWKATTWSRSTAWRRSPAIATTRSRCSTAHNRARAAGIGAALRRARHPDALGAGAARPAFAPGAVHAHHAGAAGRRGPPRGAAPARAAARPGARRSRRWNGCSSASVATWRGLTALLDRLDRASLAAQRRITVPFLRQTLGHRLIRRAHASAIGDARAAAARRPVRASRSRRADVGPAARGGVRRSRGPRAIAARSSGASLKRGGVSSAPARVADDRRASRRAATGGTRRCRQRSAAVRRRVARGRRVKREVAVRVLRRVVDQHQVRIAGGFARQAGEIVVGPDVAVDREERVVVAEQRAARAACRRRFPAASRLRRSSAGAGPSARRRRAPAGNCVGQPAGVDHDVAHAERGELFQVPDDQRLAARLQQRLGRGSVSGRMRSPRPAAKINAFMSGDAFVRRVPSSRQRRLDAPFDQVVPAAPVPDSAAARRRGRRRSAARRRGICGLPSRWCRRAKMPMTLRWRCTPIQSASRRNARSAGTGRPAAGARAW